MRRAAIYLIPLFAALLLVAGCSSSGTSGTAPPTPPAPVLPPPLKEAPAPVRANLRAELAAGYYERGQMDVALEELGNAVKLDPTNPKIYNVYGLVYATLGDNANAEQNFRKAIELAPNDSDILQNWGWYLCTSGRASEAIPQFELAVRNPLYKTPDVALTNAGRCAASIGENQRAEAFYRRALSITPNNATSAYSLALLLYQEGRFEAARAWMKPIMQQTSPQPEVLQLGMCIERKLGDRGAEASYVSQLRNRYPDSDEARTIATGACP